MILGKVFGILLCECLENVIKHPIAVFNNLNQTSILFSGQKEREMDEICIEKQKRWLENREVVK